MKKFVAALMLVACFAFVTNMFADDAAPTPTSAPATASAPAPTPAPVVKE